MAATGAPVCGLSSGQSFKICSMYVVADCRLISSNAQAARQYGQTCYADTRNRKKPVATFRHLAQNLPTFTVAN